jgi:transposase
MQQIWIGIDVAKDSFEAATPADETRSFPNNRQGAAALLEWARAVPGFCGQIAMEATGIYSQTLAIILHELKAQPAIVNPCHIHAYGRSFGRRNKTDKIDAKLITRFANERQPRLWEPADPACQALKTLLEQRENANQEQDRLSKQISTMATPPKILIQRQKANAKYIKELEEEIGKTENNDEQLKRDCALIRTIPGVGPWSARAILACLGNLADFSRRSIASYTGLAPCVYHSGTYNGGGHIPHTGPYLIKKYLYMAAQANTQPRMKNSLADHYHKLRSNHKSGKQALCALMRKMLLIARALIVSGKPYDAEFKGKTPELLVEN